MKTNSTQKTHREIFENFLQQELNQQQKEAVLYTNGPVLVIAGAGSGKTRVITARITNLLLQEQVSAHAIIALTFTNKAATEMRERILQFVETGTRIPFIGTFHAYCLYLMRLHSKLLPFEPFSILDEDDKISLLTKILKKSNFYKKITPQQCAHIISKIKNFGVYELSYQEQQMREIFINYEKEKRASNCFDFDDLLLETSKLLKNPEIQIMHQQRVRHVLIDEYQDTNTIQHELLKLFALSNNKNSEITCVIDSLCAVGDEDQSIYSWRGATVENIINFKNDFKDTKLIKIEQNYRSKQPILDVANAVIRHNKNRNEKKLWSEQSGVDCVRAIQCLSGYQEAEIIARYCKLLLETPHKNISTAILYRTHYQSRTLEEALLKLGVSYQIIGGIRFYERKEIKDLIAFLRLIANPFDHIACMRVINCPTRGLGDKFQEEFFDQWATQPLLNIHQISQFCINKKLFSDSKITSLQNFLAIFADMTPETSALYALTTLLSRSNYIRSLQEIYEKEEAKEREENIKEFLGAAQFFASQNKISVALLLEEISLLLDKPDTQHEDNTEKTTQQTVKLMTIHAAKGLEFNHVIISGIEESIFPSQRSLASPESLEEERRLFYVALTRAKQKALLTYARYRQTYGKMETQQASRFFDEIPQKLCKSTRADNWQLSDIQAYFSQWLGISHQRPELLTFGKPTQKILEKTPEFFTPQPTTTSAMQRAKNQLAQKITQRKQTSQRLDLVSPGLKSQKHEFQKNQTVEHPVFGTGIVQDVEEKNSHLFVTARFTVGTKKIDSSFLTKI